MTSSQQRAELQRRIWQIANEVRGAVDGWDFKQYVLGTLFYRFISENFASYIEGGDDSTHYAELPDTDKRITQGVKDDAIKTKGFFLYPSQLFAKVAASANTNESLNTDLAAIFAAIESSANGYPSEHDIKGLFADFDTTSNRLGNTVKDKNARLAAVLKGVAGLDFGDAHDGDFEDNQIDLFGDAYEFLISNYAANAGKSGGEFFTPQHVSKLIAQLAMHKQTSVNKIYDPACGSGSLLLQAKKHFDAHIIEDGFYGQEINHTTYNLARMNMFLHNINYDKFNVQLGNTLIAPHFGDDKPFDAIVSNPPYSVKWIGSDDPTLINDERFRSRSHAPAWECIPHLPMHKATTQEHGSQSFSFPRSRVGMHTAPADAQRLPRRSMGASRSRSHAPAWECIPHLPMHKATTQEHGSQSFSFPRSRVGMHTAPADAQGSHAGAWEPVALVPTLPRGNAYGI